MAQPQPDPMCHLGPMGPSPSLASNTDPNRVFARDQPPNLREAFNEFYPNGLPHVYRMLQTPGAKGVPQTYLENYLPVGFYKNPKIEAGAAFSTQNGLRPFRYVEQLLSQRRIHLWSKDEIQSVCNSLRKSYWENMKSMQRPHCWDSLWSYFDACDIYNYGALNLWNVVNQLFDENQVIYMDVAKEKAIETSRWADEWLRAEDNDKKLLQWDETKGPILRVLTDEDWITLGTIDDAELVLFVTNALKYRRCLLLSPEKLRPDAKPNHLMTSCSNKNLENWLAGQRIFEPSGLPPPPKVESHHGSPTSKKTPAPCMMQNGEHYFQPPGQQVASAVETLQHSVAAVGPVAPESDQAVSAGHIDTYSTTTWNALREPPEARSKSTEPTTSFNVHGLYLSNGGNDKPVGLSCAHGSSTEAGSQDEDELDADTPTKIRKRGHDNPRATKGGQKSTVTASLPGSAVMRYSAPILASATAQAGNDAQQTNQATSSPPKENQSRQNDKTRGVETQASVIKELQKNQRPNRTLARSGFHDQMGAQYPDNTNTMNRLQLPYSEFQTNTVAKDFPEESTLLNLSGMHAPLGITFHEPGHHPGTFNHSIQGAYSVPQPSSGIPTGLGNRHPNVQQPPMSQKVLTPNRRRNNSNGSRFDRFELNDTRWPQQNQENLNGANPGFGRGSYQRGVARRGRGGGHNSRNATAPVMQPHLGSDLVHKKRGGTPWRDQWRRGGSNLIQVTCENVQNGLTINDYVPCSCQMCEARNRSVYITTEVCQDIPQADMLSRIKFGLSERYGFVEEVYPLPSKEPGRFIARFADSCSVGEALTMGGGNMPEHGISVTFSPALRSKWTLSAQAPTRAVAGQSVDQHSSIAHFSPYPFGLSMANNSVASTTNPMPPRVNYPPMANAVQAHNNQIWPKSRGQRTLSGFVQPQTFGHAPNIRYPMTEFQQFVPGKPILDSNQVHAPATTQLEKYDKLIDEPLQTKPPAEEALNDIHHISQGVSDSPRSDGKSTGLKARVSLPNTPSKTSHSRHEPSTMMVDYQVPIEKAHLGRNSTMKLDGNLGSGRGNRTEADAVPCPQAMLASETTSTYTHSRVPSAFTEHEIKERRQAWAKISMPLYPRRPNSSTPMKPGGGNAKDAYLRVVQVDKHETTATEPDRLTTPTPNVMFTPDTGSVHEPSPDKLRDTMSSQRSQSLPSIAHSIDSGEERESVPEEPRQHRAQATHNTAEFSATANESLTYQCEPSNQVDAPKGSEQTVPPQESCPNSRPESPSGTQTKGRPTKTKKSKKKKAKQNVLSHSNAVDHNTHQQTSSVPRSDHMISPDLKVSVGEESPGRAPGSHSEGQESGASTPMKRHHEELEHRSVSGSFKRSKKHESTHKTIPCPSQLQQNSFDESNSPDGGTHGRKGFRIGRGGSLRMTKQRRPRAIMPGSVITEQHHEVQKSPLSSDFAFQCQSHSTLAGLPGVHGADNTATSRLNPQAQEFVSPSGLADFIDHLTTEPSDTETPGRHTLGGSVTHTPGQEADNLKPFNIELPNNKNLPHDDSVSSTTSDLTPKHRRARSEMGQKDTPKKGKGPASQVEAKKTPAKNSKRGKGKERAVTMGTKSGKVESKHAMTPGTPRTPKQQDTKAKNPGLINEDWPTLPASRDRAQSKPQTPSIWGTKTQNAGEDHSGRGSPFTKG
ncbi:hypothetical protein FHETE_4548 [Fusarium heterosporum]|uniref:Uncharacterized protein n=1 Tax=Fusarium heterosporum TaxID=42747 RepID=A0A8H5TIY7_FUSHE|nr:hypothetical protein FHETE_4548 [Fusarium heterosporum]